MKTSTGKKRILAWLLIFALLMSTTPAYAVGTGYSKEDYQLESRHFIWTVEDTQNQSGLEGSTALGWNYLLDNISPTSFNKWMSNLDKAYEAYAGLVGGTPANGAKLKLVKDTANPGAWAFVTGRDYIFWNQHCIADALKSIDEKNGDESCRGILHEIGHLFDIGSWAFNPECFANFKMYYAMAKAGLSANNTSGTFQTGQEQWDFYYGAAKRDFANSPSTIKIFDGDATAEPPLVVLGAIFEGLGGWKTSSGATGYQGWDVFQKVFQSYNDPNYQVDSYYSKESSVDGKDYNTVRDLLRRLKEFSGKDVYSFIPADVKEQVERRYFPLNDTEGRKPNVVEYQSPTGILSNGDGGLTLTLDRSATPVAGKKLTVNLFPSAFRYGADGTAVPHRDSNAFYSFAYSFTGNESVTQTGRTYQITIPFSAIHIDGRLSLASALNGGGISGEGHAAWVYLDEGAFTYSGGTTPYREWGDKFFRKAYDKPAISSSEPANKAVNVAASGDLKIVFSAQMDKNAGNVSLNSTPLSSGVWSGDGRTYTVPYDNLSADTIYTAQLSGFRDPYGNALPASGISFTRAAAFPDTSEAIDVAALSGDTAKTNWSYDAASKTLTLNAGANVTLKGTVADGTRVTVANNAGNISVALNGLSISTTVTDAPAFYIASGSQVTMTLVAGSVNTLSATGSNSNGLRLSENASLTLDGNGALTASGGDSWPGIGGGGEGRNITINGGVITANGGSNAAGIGGSWGGGGGNITINGGTVKATSGINGAGIGGGNTGAGGTITIRGGTVEANGTSGAGIGSGCKNSAGSTNVTIAGGTVSAKGNRGAGIGSGDGTNSGDPKNATLAVTIDGGAVTATGTGSAAGIGGGTTCTAGDVTINGGAITAASGDSANGDWGPAIGAGFDAPNTVTGNNAITINGGTINAINNNTGAPILGGRNYQGYLTPPTLTINGGSLYLSGTTLDTAANRIVASGGVKNDAGQPLAPTALHLVGAPDQLEKTGTAITDGSIAGTPCSTLLSSAAVLPNGYGIHDVSTREDLGTPTVFFWLPASSAAEEITVTAGGNRYLGNFARPVGGAEGGLTINRWEIELSQSGTLVFEKQSPGYSPVAEQTVTVTNKGNVETGELRVGLSGTDAASFELAGARQESSTQISGLLLDSIPAGESASFTIKPRDGLSGKTDAYAATVSVTGAHSMTGSFAVNFAVHTTPSDVAVTEPSPVTYPDSVNVQITVTPAPTGNMGTVTLYKGDVAVSEAVPVEKSGVVSVPLTTEGKKLSVGANSLVARYSGNTTQEGADSAAFSVTVNPKALTATADPSKVYDGSASFAGVTLVLNGVREGDTATGSMAGTTAAANAGSSDFTVGEITLSGEDAGWYTLAQGNVTANTATITAKPVTVTISGPESHEYDGTSGYANHTASYETVNGDAANATVLYDGNEERPTDVKSSGYTLTARMNDSNYRAETVTGVSTFTITPAEPSATTDTKALTILYTNTEPQTVTAADFGIEQAGSFAIRGTVTDESHILSDTPTAGNTVSFQLKSGLTGAEGRATIPVTFTPANGNYQAKDLTITVALQAKTDVSAAITFTDGSAVYTGAAQLHETATIADHSGTFTYTYAALEGSALTDGKPVDVGGYTVTAIYDDAQNHGTKSAAFTITQATPTIHTAPTATGTLYVNSPLSSLSLTGGTASTGGGFAFQSPDTTFGAAGAQTVKAVFTPTDTKNYTSAEVDVSVNAEKRTARSVPALESITDKPYGTIQAELELIDAVYLTTEDGKTFFNIPVTWDGYRSDTLDRQNLVGTLDLSAIADEVKQDETPVVAFISVTLQPLAPGAVDYNDHPATYTSQPITHELSALPTGVSHIDYSYAESGGSVLDQAPTHAGAYTVTATFTMEAGYAQIEAKTVNLTIEAKSLADSMIQAIPDQRYTGDSIHPAVTVQDGAVTLVESTDYTVSYGANNTAGTGSVTITGTGDYKGTAQGTFSIIKSDATMTVTPDSNTVTFGDSLTVQVSGIAAQSRSNAMERNTVALYVGNAELTPIATATVQNGAATLTYDTTNKALTVGDNTLYVRYGGSDNLNAYVSAPFTVTLNKATPTPDVPTGLTATFGNTLASVALPSGWAWDAPTTSVGAVGNRDFPATYTSPTDTDFYNTVLSTVTIAVGKATAPQVTDPSASFRYTLTGAQTQTLANLLPEDRGVTSYQLDSVTGDAGILSNASVSTEGALTYTLTGTGTAGNSAVIPVTVTMGNYADVTVCLTVTLMEKDVPVLTAKDITATYGQTLKISGTAKVNEQDVSGTWSFKNTPPTDAGAYPSVAVVFTPDDTANYSSAETTIQVTIGKSGSTFEPTVNQNGVFTYGDTITVEFTPEIASANAILGAEPSENQAALFLGDTQLTEAVTADQNGKFTLRYDTSDQGISVGQSQILTVKYGGSGNLNAGAAAVAINLSPKTVTAEAVGRISKVYDGTDVATVTLQVNDSDKVDLGDDITITATAKYSDKNAESGKAVTLSAPIQGGTDSAFYAVSLPDGVTGDITRVEGQMLTIEQTISYNDTQEKSLSIDDSLRSLLADGDAPSYELGAISDENSLLAEGTAVSESGGLTVALAEGLTAEINEQSAFIPITVTGLTNYEEISVTVIITVTDAIAVTVDLSGLSLESKTYDGAPLSYTGEATGTFDDAGTPYSGDFIYSWCDGEGNPIHGAPIKVGTYQLKVTVSGQGYMGTGSRRVDIFPATPGAPDGLSALRPTTEENKDGKIIGLDSNLAYEYRAQADAGYTAVDQGSEITGLVPGTYAVRLKADENHNASADTSVTVKRFMSTVSVRNVTANGSSGSATTTELTLTLDGGFDQLTADQITLTGAVKGTLTHQGGGVYILTVSGIPSNGATVTVTLASDDYGYTPASTDVTVFRYVSSSGGSTGGSSTGNSGKDESKTETGTTTNGSVTTETTTTTETKPDGSKVTEKTEVIKDSQTGTSTEVMVTETVSKDGGTKTTEQVKTDVTASGEKTETKTIVFEDIKTGVTAQSEVIKNSAGGAVATVNTQAKAEVTHSADGTATAAVSSETAAKLIQQAKAATQSAAKEADNVKATITIQVDSGSAKQAMEVSIPAEVVSTAAEAGTELKVVSGMAEVTLGTEAAATVSKTAGEDTMVKLEVKPTEIEALPETVRSELAEADIVELNLYVGDSKVSQFGGRVTVSIPYTPKDPGNILLVYHIADDGTKTLVPGAQLVNGTVVFNTEHFSHYAIVEEEWKNPFTDVKGLDWFFDAVCYASHNGLFAGTTETTFSPNVTMTRAMFFTVLARADGQDTTGGETWYSRAMDWAKSTSVSDGTNPDGFLTREQLATMLYRYAGSPATTGTLDGFTDAAAAGSYAVDALKWAVEQGIITGKGGGVLDPKGNATRAQVAAMLMRYLMAN